MNLESLNVVELEAPEMRKVDGGWWQAALAVAGAVIYVYNNWDDLVDGYNEEMAR